MGHTKCHQIHPGWYEVTSVADALISLVAKGTLFSFFSNRFLLISATQYKDGRRLRPHTPTGLCLSTLCLIECKGRRGYNCKDRRPRPGTATALPVASWEPLGAVCWSGSRAVTPPCPGHDQDETHGGWEGLPTGGGGRAPW